MVISWSAYTGPVSTERLYVNKKELQKSSAPSTPYPSKYQFPSLQMSLYIRDRIVLPPYFKIELLSAIFSAISYGIVVVLAGNCFHLLLKKRDTDPDRMRILLPIYVIVMLLSSTWKQIGSICILMTGLTSKPVSLLLYRSFGLPITVTIWGADGFMVRILILCQ